MYILCWIGRRNKEHWRIFETAKEVWDFILNPRNGVVYENGRFDRRTVLAGPIDSTIDLKALLKGDIDIEDDIDFEGDDECLDT